MTKKSLARQLLRMNSAWIHHGRAFHSLYSDERKQPETAHCSSSLDSMFHFSNSPESPAVMFFSQEVMRDRFLEGQLLSGMYTKFSAVLKVSIQILTVQPSELSSSSSLRALLLKGLLFSQTLTFHIDVDDGIVWHPGCNHMCQL